MKVIQLGSANDALCHFLSLGGLEFLLDCGLPPAFTVDVAGVATAAAAATATAAPGAPLRMRLPALHAIDVASLDVLLLSNHASMLALPFVTEQLGFQGKVFATELTLAFGCVLLKELALAAQTREVVFECGDSSGGTQPLRAFSLADVAASCAKVTCVEFKEVVELAYGVRVTALSSGFSLGASAWLLDAPTERFAYVPAASGDLNRHPKELDLLPLVDCETLLLTDLKPDRDPHATTERQVERLLATVTRVLDRGGACVIPCAPTGVLLDLVEAVYAACVHNRATAVPLYFVAPHAQRVLALPQRSGAEWLCEKKVEKLYAGERAFVHDSLQRTKVLTVETAITPALAAVLQSASIVFVGHPSLQIGLAPELLRMISADARNAVVLIDPSVDPRTALLPFHAAEMEKIVCPIDPRLSCGDANQLIARCCPRTLLVPAEYTAVDAALSVSSGGLKPGDPAANELSHFARVMPLHELTAAKPKTELLTLPMRALEPLVLDKSQKYIDGLLDPNLAAKAMLTEVNGKAVACVSGVLSVKRRAFMLEATAAPAAAITRPSDTDSAGTKPATGKRKASALATSVTAPLAGVEYREKSAMLLGQVDEDKLERQVKAHDPHAQVYISQGQGDADVFMSIPSLDARVTLWKEAAKTIIETEKEDARALLTSFVLAQLVVISQ